MGQLAASSSKIQEGLREVVEHTKKVAEGDYDQIFNPRSDGDALSIALNVMVSKLKEARTKAEQDFWFKSGINQSNSKYQTTSGYFFKFMVVSIIGLGINSVIFYYLRNYLDSSRFISLVSASAGAIIWNFVLNKIWTYKINSKFKSQNAK